MNQQSIEEQIRIGADSAYIDGSIESISEFTPRFITNNSTEPVIRIIEDELNACTEFKFSVAFITEGGLTPIKQTLLELQAKKIKGRIITTDYLTFSDPNALDDILGLDNIELRMYQTKGKVGFHTKGYIFQDNQTSRILIGSSNLTHDAIMQNHEWNSRIVAINGAYKQNIEHEFEYLWNESTPYKECREEYVERYNINKANREQILKLTRQVEIGERLQALKPNAMQQSFVSNLARFVEEHRKRAILVSATGTGKTYASAFGVKELLKRSEFKKDRVLFLSHREQINKQALNTFYNVLGGNKEDYGLLSGSYWNFDKRYLFSTMQMMSKDEVMKKFNERDFSIIIIDECHRAGAASYQKIIDYFHPKMLLGMSASPERTDDFNVYSLFNYNIAYEIRLNDALKENFLCPFHYFGITDLETIDDENPKNEEDRLKRFNLLTSDERVKHIIDKINYFGHSGDRVKGLVFCSRKEEAQELSRKFNTKGFKTKFLSGGDSQEVREEAINRLTGPADGNHLDYIFTVDIFNEGVDIPEVNQVVMLRPTQSAVIFVQQLGRGLRKFENKEFVVIIDFIGNYNNNYMIPIAISGDHTGNKDNYRKFMHDPKLLGGATIHFDEISRERIYAKIDEAKMNEMAILKSDYKDLKFKIGRIPSLLDYDKYEAADPLRFIDKCKSYYNFLVKVEKNYTVRISDEECKFIDFVSSKLANGKRPHELEYLKAILESSPYDNMYDMWLQRMAYYDFEINDIVSRNVLNVLNGTFYAVGGAAIKTAFVTENGYSVLPEFAKALKNKTFRELLQEVVDFGLHRWNTQYKDHYEDTSLVLGKKYTYEDVCRLLNWVKTEVSLNIGGYKYDSASETYPVYINYDKADDIQDTIKYEDRFVDPATLIAISKQGRTLESPDVDLALHSKERGVDMFLFVRKNKDDKESKEFYFLGKMQATGKTAEFVMPNTTKTAVEIEYHLDTPIESGLYKYITK